MSRQSTPDKAPLPGSVPRGLLLGDTLAELVIRVIGVGIILSVFGIFVFIVWQTLPLFRNAKVTPSATVAVPDLPYVLLGVDEWTELPFLLTKDGQLHFTPLASGADSSVIDLGLPVTVAAYDPRSQTILTAFSPEMVFHAITYQSKLSDADKRLVSADVQSEPPIRLETRGALLDIDFYQTERRRMVVALLDTDSGIICEIIYFQRRVGLMGAGQWRKVSSQIHVIEGAGNIEQVMLGGNGSILAAASGDGEVIILEKSGDDFVERQRILPFGDGHQSLSMAWVSGRRTLLLGGEDGSLVTFIPHARPDGSGIVYTEANQLNDLPSGMEGFSPSINNRSFLVTVGNEARLFYGTTGDELWQSRMPFTIRKAIIGLRYQTLLFLGDDGLLHRYALDDPHPGASLRAFLGQIRYEGYDEPRFLWQSTGGGDAFEPKLSLVPLIVGSIKGTLYALLFAIPVALTAAIYTAYFIKPDFKRIIKPTMEIMASLPSVVLGFLAALWLAPLIDGHIPSVLLGILAIPVSALVLGWLISLMHSKGGMRMLAGWEFLVLVPVSILAFCVGWWLGPLLESVVFTVHDPATGQSIGDFRLWWEERVGLQYEQRNALVVGFMMGFAVIPLIFTLSDDALSNVPGSLVSGSLALGASRWDTVRRIILPVALPGIFSALMIGLGRAVGETMIVVMATGNTPLTDMNIFSGMRTLAANIAVELPEAPFQGTLYRTLFLGALLLFILTFVVNTIAEITRVRIRRRFGKIA